MIWDALHQWLRDECYGGDADPQVMMIKSFNKVEFEKWADESNVKYSMVDYSRAPRPPHAWSQDYSRYTSGERRWKMFRNDHKLYYFPDHTTFIYSKMAWSN